MGRAQPNFNIGDIIQEWIDTGDEYAFETMRSYYENHPRKFVVTLTWVVGRDSETYRGVLAAIAKAEGSKL